MVRRRDPTTGRWNSKPKYAFPTEMDARIVSRRYFLYDGHLTDAYRCTKCAFWHVGRRPTNPMKANGGRYSLPQGARGIYTGRQRLYRMLRKYEAQIR